MLDTRRKIDVKMLLLLLQMMIMMMKIALDFSVVLSQTVLL